MSTATGLARPSSSVAFPATPGSGLIDLRSEAVAPLHPEVRAALCQAPEGSDSYDDDAAGHELEARMSEMFGMASALFVPTGRMANAMAIGLLAGPGTEILADADAHIVRSEYGLSARLWSTQTRTFTSADGRLNLLGVEPLLSVLENTTMPTRLVCVEDTHAACGGAPQEFDALRQLTDRLARRGVGLYCDGARIWYANVVQAVPWRAYGDLYDGLAVSLVKGIGAPCGAMLLMRDGRREEMRDMRRMLGGAWVRPGPLASAALRALDVNAADPARDCANAALFAQSLRAELPGLHVLQETNIVMFDVPDSALFFEKCRADRVLVFRFTPTRVRAVFHRGVSTDDARTAALAVRDAYLSSE